MHLTLRVGSHLVALPAQRVREVVSLEGAVVPPVGPQEVAGLLNVRGAVYTVLDPTAILGIETAAEPAPEHAVLLDVPDRRLALAAFEPAASVPTEKAGPRPSALPLPPALAATTVAVARLEAGWAAVLDLEALLARLAAPA